jgi:hypothetical protein
MPLQQFSPAQAALLRNLFIQGGEGTIPGSWLVDGSVDILKLDQALQDLINVSVITTTADITLDSTHDIVLIDSTSAPVIVTLPLIENKVFEVKFAAGTNAASVASAAGIDGELSVTLFLYESLTMACDGSKWSII